MPDTFESTIDVKAKGSPSWMTTFADLMSLLMCFFVLLLSYSEMDVVKFKQIAGSMKLAFGVQNQIPLEDIPKGTSIIAQQFSPSKPEPTAINTVQQFTQETAYRHLRVAENLRRQNDEIHSLNEKYKRHLSQVLAKEVEQDLIELELLGQQLIIRLKERGSFASGSSYLQPQFKPLLSVIAKELDNIPGLITVSGHTDNRSVSNELHQNNWDLSAKRAAAVLGELILDGAFDATRIKMEALADNNPIVDNNNATNRGKNRRVEIAISQGRATEVSQIPIN